MFYLAVINMYIYYFSFHHFSLMWFCKGNFYIDYIIRYLKIYSCLHDSDCFWAHLYQNHLRCLLIMQILALTQIPPESQSQGVGPGNLYYSQTHQVILCTLKLRISSLVEGHFHCFQFSRIINNSQQHLYK